MNYYKIQSDLLKLLIQNKLGPCFSPAVTDQDVILSDGKFLAVIPKDKCFLSMSNPKLKYPILKDFSSPIMIAGMITDLQRLATSSMHTRTAAVKRYHAGGLYLKRACALFKTNILNTLIRTLPIIYIALMHWFSSWRMTSLWALSVRSI